MFVESVTQWLLDPASWLAPGPIAQFVGILLLAFAFLQSLNATWADGKLFSRKIAWITYILTAIYVLVIFVIPFVGWTVGIAILVAFALLFFALRVKESWKTQ